MEYVASEIGIWLAGHAIVPMGDKYPKDRIEYIMHHCESPLLINDEVIQAMMKTEPTENYVLPNEEDINALFYTSGSTGVPKGVMHSFRSLNFAVTFDIELMQTVSPLALGVTSPPILLLVVSILVHCFWEERSISLPLQLSKTSNSWKTILRGTKSLLSS